MSEEVVLNLGEDSNVNPVFRAQDPVIGDLQKSTDFPYEYPIPLPVEELIAMCEEVTLYRSLPEVRTALNAVTWRELNVLGMVSGGNAVPSAIAFADGECPETFDHDGDSYTVYHKNIGARKALSIRDIMHSAAVAGVVGIGRLIGGVPSFEGLPGTSDSATFIRENVSDIKEKEIRLASTLVLNGWDRLLVVGNSSTNPLEFDGLENYAANMSISFHTNSDTSGSFSAEEFDRFLAEGCAHPTHLVGHPQAIQEILADYFQLGYAGQQVINYADGSRIVPGFNFAGVVNTGIGPLTIIADRNFTRTDLGGGTFRSSVFALRMTHNGDPLVYKSVQVPLSLNDLAPGCTAIAFQVWAATALIVKGGCMQSRYTKDFTGRIASTCAVIG